MFEAVWNPVDVKIETAVWLFPTGAITAGVRRGARTVAMLLGNAVKVWKGEVPGHCSIGGVPLDAFSITINCQKRK